MRVILVLAICFISINSFSQSRMFALNELVSTDSNGVLNSDTVLVGAVLNTAQALNCTKLSFEVDYLCPGTQSLTSVDTIDLSSANPSVFIRRANYIKIEPYKLVTQCDSLHLNVILFDSYNLPIDTLDVANVIR